MNHLLRKFENGDEKKVKSLILSILAVEYPFDKSAYSDSDLDKIAEVYGEPGEVFFVVEENGQIVGTTGVKKETEEDALLRRVFVDADHRRQGIGKELLEKAVSFCRSKGYKKIIFRCTDRMADAIRLCIKEGFTEKESLEIGGFKIHKLEMGL